MSGSSPIYPFPYNWDMPPTVRDVTTTTVKLPYRDIPGKHLVRQNPHWNYFRVFEVELDDGTTGFGAGRWITWPLRDLAPHRNRVMDARPAALLWDDRLPEGLHRALFDAVGRSLGVPIHELFGERGREEVPLSWGCIDMSPEDWLAECRTAIDQGYTAVKLKGRPWWDIREQLELLTSELPSWFEISIDFNATLLDADRAIPLL